MSLIPKQPFEKPANTSSDTDADTAMERESFYNTLSETAGFGSLILGGMAILQTFTPDRDFNPVSTGITAGTSLVAGLAYGVHRRAKAKQMALVNRTKD